MSAKQHFAETFHRENATTRRVLRALPHDKSEFRPAPNANTAREIASIFARGQGRIAAALTNQWEWPPKFPPPPATYAEVLAAFDATTATVKDALAKTPESRLDEKVMFFTGPRQFGEIPVRDLIWFMLLDSIHHRGQLSTYLRVAGEKVPSIYGPTADEKWS
jgi:uncharacterized damage-inducible protein DinB